MKARRNKGAPLGSGATVDARFRHAAFDRRVVILALADDSVVPSPDDIADWVQHVTSTPGVTTIRTSALFPRAAASFREAGFVAADTLALLRVDLADDAVRAVVDGDGRRRSPSTTVSLRTGEFATAAAIDQAAFGPRWGHDAAELELIREATPHFQARARVRRGGLLRRDVLAVAISGASSQHGYLQRLSVHPDEQRAGHGRALTIDALRWMRRRRLQDCLVNTSVDNAAALGLYESVGFRRLSDNLEVLEFDVADR